METGNKLEDIKKVAFEFFQKMGFFIETKNLFLEEKTIYLSIKSEEPKVLIGKNGRTLEDIQKILGIILRKKGFNGIFFNIDIDNYRQKKAEYLKELARESADEVALTKKEKLLEPMPAYERRIIHLELSNRPDVESVSQGEGEERRIVISPK